MSVSGICALCEKSGPLRQSHILPAFVFRWLRKRSVTGHIRRSDEIDLRIQDGIKKPWLCGNCEGLFALDEKQFASRLFHLWPDAAREYEYNEWLLRFCTSVSWRVLKHCKGLNPDQVYTAQEDRAAEQAEVAWQSFLLGRKSSVGRFEQHLLPWDFVQSTSAHSLPTNFNRYITGAVEMDIIGTSKMMMTYAKLGRFMIFGMIRMGREPWEGTKIFAQHGHIRARRYVLPGNIGEFINSRASHVQEAFANMSEAQVAKVDAAVMQNIDTRASSDQVRAMLADAELFGKNAIIRRR